MSIIFFYHIIFLSLFTNPQAHGYHGPLYVIRISWSPLISLFMFPYPLFWHRKQYIKAIHIYACIDNIHIYNIYLYIPVAILYIHICLYLILLKIYVLRIFPRLKCLFNWIFYVVVCFTHLVNDHFASCSCRQCVDKGIGVVFK